VSEITWGKKQVKTGNLSTLHDKQLLTEDSDLNFWRR